MKIQGSDAISRLKQILDRADSENRSQKSASQATKPTRDDFQLSAQARELQLLRGAAELEPQVREDLVAQLRDEIASGQYRIDGTKVAQGMLDEEGSLTALQGDGGES